MKQELFKIDKENVPMRRMAREQIYEFEDALTQGIEEDSIEEFDCNGINLTHRFIDGVYARELIIPAGIVVVGKLHKFPRICIISSGDCIAISEFGRQRIKAPHTEVMQPGTKTAVYAIEDTVWTAIHGTNLKEVDKLENHFIAKDHASYEWSAKKNLGV